MARTLTTATDCNPAALLRAEYSSLTTIACRDELAAEATRIVEASTISKKNLAKWHRNVAKIPSQSALISYITNFLLAADGDRVLVERQGMHDATRREYRNS